MQEVRYADSATWVTLTYETPPLTDTNQMTLRKPDVQNFFKRLRKIRRSFSKLKIKYYLCGEYGDTYYRPHYHAVIFNSCEDHINKAWSSFTSMGDPEGVRLGTCYFDEVNETTVAYTAKYMNKMKKIPLYFEDLRLPEFQLFSKGLGIGYLTDAVKTYYNACPTRNDVMVNGYRKSLPRYFMDKLVICPVFKKAKQLYAQDKAEALFLEQQAEWNENKTYGQTFEQFRYQRRKVHNQFFLDKITKRDKFK